MIFLGMAWRGLCSLGADYCALQLPYLALQSHVYLVLLSTTTYSAERIKKPYYSHLIPKKTPYTYTLRPT